MPLKIKSKNFESKKPLLDSHRDALIDLDLSEILAHARDAFGDEGAALAENIRRNLTESVRQPRNKIHADLDARKTKVQVSDSTDLQPKAQTERNTQASFETHMRAVFRRVATEIGNEMRSQVFMGMSPDKAPRVISAKEFADENHANLGRHPHSEEVAVPIPPALASETENAAKLMKLKPKDRAAWRAAANLARAQNKPLPPIPSV